MSKIGNKPIQIPSNVTLDLTKKDTVQIKGPKGMLFRSIPPMLGLNVEKSQLVVVMKDENPKSKPFQGLFRMLLHNMIVGVTEGHKKSLEIIGIGYTAQIENTILKLNVGKSHLVYVQIPTEVHVTVEALKRGKSATTYIHFAGMDKEIVGHVAAQVRKQKPPEPYISKRDNKSKGIRYTDELYVGKVKKNA